MHRCDGSLWLQCAVTAWLAELSACTLAVTAIGVAIRRFFRILCAAQIASTRGCVSQDRVEQLELSHCGFGFGFEFARAQSFDSSGVQGLQKHRLTSFSDSEFVAAVDALGRRWD